MKTRPNIFDFATSELSQDAFLCWLISWADKDYKELDEDIWRLSHRFIRLMIDVPVETVEVRKQYKHIDVSAIVNNKYFLIIEDKKGTSETIKQLKDYKKVKVSKDGIELENKTFYFKMEEQSDLSNIKTEEYEHIKRSQVLEILGSYCSSVAKEKQNHILVDFYENLVRLDFAINSYKTLLPKDWEYYQWMGLFSQLQKSGSFEKVGWGYVSNPSGGFMGFWWNFLSPKSGLPTLYLQAQEGLLTFRMASEAKEINSTYKEIYQKTLFEIATKEKVELAKYGSAGKSMGIYKLATDFLITDSEGVLDYDKTVAFMLRVSKIATLTAEKLKDLNLNDLKNGKKRLSRNPGP